MVAKGATQDEVILSSVHPNKTHSLLSSQETQGQGGFFGRNFYRLLKGLLLGS